jgi:acetyl-CoA carboxylase biotin carboxylase subunit
MSESKSPCARLLIANRGEIAVRIVRAAHSLGIETVLAASAADSGSLAAQESEPSCSVPQPPGSRI